jgi:charged multivesicular body protein 7
MESGTVGEFIRTEVGDWDDEAVGTARFKAFSGQKCDWESRYEFWKALILKIARRFGLLVISPLDVKNNWFNRGGLTPLCLDQVLVRLPLPSFHIYIYIYIYFFFWGGEVILYAK